MSRDWIGFHATLLAFPSWSQNDCRASKPLVLTPHLPRYEGRVVYSLELQEMSGIPHCLLTFQSYTWTKWEFCVQKSGRDIGQGISTGYSWNFLLYHKRCHIYVLFEVITFKVVMYVWKLPTNTQMCQVGDAQALNSHQGFHFFFWIATLLMSLTYAFYLQFLHIVFFSFLRGHLSYLLIKRLLTTIKFCIGDSMHNH